MALSMLDIADLVLYNKIMPKKTYKPGQLQSTTHRVLNSKRDTVSMSMLLPKQLHLHTGRILMAISFMIGIIYILALFVG